MDLTNINYIKPIEGYENYYITVDGKVWSEQSKKFLSLRDNGHGYLLVWLYKDKKRKGFLVHRLVAAAFLDNPNNYQNVNHKDENRLNNNANNLEWCDMTYNNNYKNHIQNVINTCIEKGLTKAVVMCDKDTHEEIQTFPSAREAGRFLGNAKNSQGICKTCNGQQKSAYGYWWKYADVE